MMSNFQDMLIALFSIFQIVSLINQIIAIVSYCPKVLLQATMLSQGNIFLFLFSVTNFLPINSFKIKSYNYNKYSPTDHHMDCVYHRGPNISIPREFSFCFRHMKTYTSTATFWSSIFIGSYHGNGSDIENPRFGVQVDYWSYVPWIGLTKSGDGNMAWVATSGETDFNMLTWRHTCLTFNLVDGSSIMYENGRFVSKSKFEELEKFGKATPEFIARDVTIGCLNYTSWKAVHTGIVTDFQLFSRILSHQELKKWTGCQDRLQGDLLSWDTADWGFNMVGNGSEIEYRHFEREVCDMRNKSLHLFPGKRTFKKSLDLCAKVSGKLNE